tara:strand:- start:214 stop:630 length:417 start_codon:yes stop_codon:yes gene_type:complete
MKAKELRIGNLVHSKADTVIMMSGWELYNMTVNENTNSETFLKPIPLTEEWLLKFGFDKPCKYDWYNKRYNTTCIEANEEMTVSWNIKSKRLSIFDSMEETDMVNILSHPIYCAQDLDYVHQLQNLYFALTGEELEIK